MTTIVRNRGLRRWAVGGLLTAGLLSVASTPVAAQGGMGASWEASLGHVARTVSHLIGIVGGLVIVYYADNIRRRTRGSTLGNSMLFVEVATGLFVLVFLGMEANHFADVHLWYFADTMALQQLWYMITLAVVMLLYTAAYRNLVVEMGA